MPQTITARKPATHSIVKHINRALARPGLAANLGRLAADQDGRVLQVRRPTVVTWEHRPSERDDFYYLKPPPGSVQLFWARRGSPLLRKVESAYSSRDVAALKELSERIVKTVKTQPMTSVETAVDATIASPVYFDLRYGGKTLASSLALPRPIEISNLLFAYNGGPLDDGRFAVADYFKRRRSDDQDKLAYDVLLVKAAPVLSELERKALEAVPEEQQEMHLASSINVANWVTVVHFVRVIVAITMTGNTMNFHHDLASNPPPDAFQNLGPAASARAMLEARRQIFEQYHR